jgi:hypothetical protein
MLKIKQNNRPEIYTIKSVKELKEIPFIAQKLNEPSKIKTLRKATLSRCGSVLVIEKSYDDKGVFLERVVWVVGYTV